MGFSSNQAILLSAPVWVHTTGRRFNELLTEPLHFSHTITRSFRFYFPRALVIVRSFLPSKQLTLTLQSARARADINTEYRIRGPVVSFNSLCLIMGFTMLGFTNQVTVRYIGIYLATGAYVSNWAALNAYQANNIVG